MPKGPNNYHPFRRRDDAIARRNYVIDRMVEDRLLTAALGEQAKKDPLKVTQRPTGAHIFAAEYFAEEVRRYVNDNYTEKKLYEGGLSVRTTLDPKLQVQARKSLIDGLVKFDENQGYRGAITKIETIGDWGAKLAEVKALSDIAPWRQAVVLDVADQSARIGFQPAAIQRRWCARSRDRNVTLEGGSGRGGVRANQRPGAGKVSNEAGDVVYADPIAARTASSGCASACLRRYRSDGAMTGRVLAMVGGFSYDQSQFTRHQARASRAPRSSCWFMPLPSTTAIRLDRRDGRAARDRYRQRVEAGKP